ncbi:LuxR C-terminal-related transcriptional regulator, partial [Lutimonas sp.]|uniref:LuxR C-terminal-related transcriptional regulator n=1 Tax=Lutimonas sp. TaxID=1872403 RepID=UPI003D9B06EC
LKESKKIASIKKYWREENYIEKNEIINSDHNIIDQISQFFAAGSFYYYIFNFATLKIEYVSENVKEVLEIEPEDLSLETLLGSYHPDDLDKLHDKEKTASEFLFKQIPPDHIIDYKVVYTNRVLTKSGKCKTILHQAKAISTTEDGRIMKVIGVHADISYLEAPIDHKISFISYKHESYFSLPTGEKKLSFKSKFSAREIEVIKSISNGNTVEEIAKLLFISEHTVRTHRKNILKKADVKNSIHLITKCIREGVI